jgi:hypothetical protein
VPWWLKTGSKNIFHLDSLCPSELATLFENKTNYQL